MPGQATPPVRRPRLNPFAFPSDTTLRFVLLVIFVICGSGQLWGEFRGPTDPAVVECISRIASAAAGYDLSSPADAERNAAAAMSMLPAQARCAALLRPAVLWQLAGMCLAVLVAAILYYVYPFWKLRANRLEPISSSEMPALQDELGSIAGTARLSDPPAFVWNPLAAGLPVAFGRHGRYYVALSGSFITRYLYSDRSAFRAVLLHELAHIRNGDVSKAYFTMSLWFAFVATSLAPAVVLFLWRLARARWFDAAPLLLYGVLWSTVIVLSGLAVLRVRECYADLQASAWDPASRIGGVLAALSPHAGEGWRRFFRFHPDPGERRQVVEDPSRLLGMGFFDAVGIGIAAWSIVEVATAVLIPFMPQDSGSMWTFLLLVKVLMPGVVLAFAIGAIGIGVWRSAFASVLRGDHPSSGTAWLGAAFVAGSFPGIAVGVAAAGLESFRETSIPFSAAVTLLLVNGVTCLFLLPGCLIIFRWIATTASAWFDVVLRRSSPRPILVSSVATASFLVLATLALTTYVVLISFAAVPWRTWGDRWMIPYGLAVGGPVVIVSLVAWAFPLAALWWRKPSVSTGLAQWVFLDGSAPELPVRPPLRARGALVTGMVAGLVCCLVWELLLRRVYFPIFLLWLVAWTEQVFGDRGFLITGSGALFQALAAAIAAACAKRLSTMCGLCAASVAGLIIVIGNIVLVDFRSGSLAASLQVWGLGAAVALPTALVAGWAGNVARRAFSSSGIARTSGRAAAFALHSPIAIAGAAILCVLVGIGVAVWIQLVVVPEREINTQRAAAERGDRDAQFKLGMMYATGKSVTRDAAQAVYWWRKAGEQGHIDAQVELAEMLLNGIGAAQDPAAAVEWLRRAAEQGHTGAELRLGVMYVRGQGVARDNAEAMHWLRRAAEKGDAEAQNLVGVLFALGWGTTPNDAAAVEWFRKAAERGHAEAQFNLGYMYQEGKGLPKDDTLALKWFRSAADQGYAGAQFRVGQMYEKGQSVPRNDEEAIYWFRKAASSGYRDARDRLQTMCDNGLRNACTR